MQTAAFNDRGSLQILAHADPYVRYTPGGQTILTRDWYFGLLLI
jgi:hypothetical protein